MTITITWWMVIIALVAAPLLWGMFYKPTGAYDFDFTGICLLIGCWTLALGILVGKYVF